MALYVRKTMNLEDLENDELISLCPKLLKELKRREIRTNNLIGELREFIAAIELKKILNYLSYYSIVEEEKNVDATSIKAWRHAIESTLKTMH